MANRNERVRPFTTNCRPHKFMEIIKKLSPEQLDIIKSMGFGVLLDLNMSTLNRILISWMATNIDPENKTLRLSGGRLISLTCEDVGRLLGLSNTGERLEILEYYGGQPIDSWHILLEKLNPSLGIGEEFRVVFLHFIFSSLLHPTAQPNGSRNLVRMIYSNPNYIISKCNISLFVFENLMKGIKVWSQGNRSGTLNGCIIFLQVFYLIKLYVPGFSFCNRLSDCTDALLKERVQKEIIFNGNLGKAAVRYNEGITAAHNVPNSGTASTSSHADAKTRIKERNALIHMLQQENEAEINNVMSGPSDQATAYDSDFVDSPPKKKRVIYKSVFVGSSSKSKVQKNGKSVASSSKCKTVQKKEKRKSPRIAKLAESKEKEIEVPSCSKEVLKDSTERNRELLAKSLADRSLKQLKNLRSAYVSKVHNQYLQQKKHASFPFERNENIFNVAHFGLLKNKRIQNDVLAKCGSFKVTRQQVRSLDDQKWVSSAVVDVFAEYINCEELNSANHRRLVCFESTFGSQLMKLVSENEINEEGVQKYAKIFERDFYEEELPKTLMTFYIPHCIDNHWALHIIDLENERVIMFDSYPVARHRIQKQISEKIGQLFATLMSKYRNKIDKLEVVDGTEVFQDNGNDCGVLMLKYLLEWKPNAKPFFTKRDSFLYRIDLVDKLLMNKHSDFHSEVCYGVRELTGCLDDEQLNQKIDKE